MISKQNVWFKSLIPMIIKTPVVSHEIQVQLQKLAMDSASRRFGVAFFKSFLAMKSPPRNESKYKVQNLISFQVKEVAKQIS